MGQSTALVIYINKSVKNDPRVQLPNPPIVLEERTYLRSEGEAAAFGDMTAQQAAPSPSTASLASASTAGATWQGLPADTETQLQVQAFPDDCTDNYNDDMTFADDSAFDELQL